VGCSVLATHSGQRLGPKCEEGFAVQQTRMSRPGGLSLASGSTSSKPAVRGLGEIALRVNDLDAMQKFYEDIIGLPLMRRDTNFAFFKVADGYGGHTQVLALFDRSQNPSYRGIDGATSTIDHIAFEISLADYVSEKERLVASGLRVITAEHDWIHWRSLYVNDPEGNEVELVCYDPAL